MQDAVADVLQERQYLDQSISTGLLLSILLHALLFVPFLVNISHAQKPIEDPVRVRLAGPQPGEVRTPASSPAPPADKPIETVQRPAEPVPTPEKVPDMPRPETKKVEKSLFGESPEKPVDRKAEDRERAAPAKQAPQEAVPTTPSQPNESAAGQSGSQGVTGIAVGGGSAQISGLEGDFPYTFYVERMLGIIGGNWFRPDVGSIDGGTIHFVIERNGRIRDVEITRSSGNSAFDRAARRAVIESSPLPPLPLQYTGSELGVHLKFN